MIRVLLVIPPHPTRKTDVSDGMPLGILYLASMIEDICEIRVLDLYSFPSDLDLAKHLNDFSPDLVGISIPFKLVEKSAIRLAKGIRSHGKAKIIVGGLHATHASDRILGEIECDYFVKGEGENVIRAIVEMLAGTSDKLSGDFQISKVNNVCVLESGIVDIDSLPFPARHVLINREKYSERLLTSRGCGFNCGFCSSRKFWGAFRGRKPDSIIDEIEQIHALRGLVPISFADDSFTFDRDRVVKFCDRIVERKVQTAGLGFSSHPSKLDESLLEKMRKAGFDSIFLGLESTSESVLEKAGKRYSVDHASRMISTASGLGFEIHASFMIGLPGQTKIDVEKTLTWIGNQSLNSLGFHIFYPFDGSPIRDDPSKFGITIKENPSNDGDIDGESVVHNGILSPDEILDLYYRVRAWQRNRLTKLKQ